MSRTKVFVSYSHRDDKWLKRLQVHLAPLVRSGAVDVWDDTRIDHGDDWNAEIMESLATTRVAVLLISADFLASSYIQSNELPPLLAAAESEGVSILPVIISASLFTETPELSRFQAVNPPDKPLIGMSRSEQEILLTTVAQAVLRLVSAEEESAPVTTTADAEPAPTEPTGVDAATRPALQPQRRPVMSATDISNQVQAARDMASAFAPERFFYLGIILVSVLIVLLGLGKSILDGTFSAPLATATLGAGGLAFVFGGRLLKIQERTLQFIEQQSRIAVPGS